VRPTAGEKPWDRRWLWGRGIELGPIRTHTTSLVSGLLFIVIGVLFIRFDAMVGFTSAIGLGDTSGPRGVGEPSRARLGGTGYPDGCSPPRWRSAPVTLS
jgi:hypothetical protein